MIQIRVSYDTPGELAEVDRLLWPLRLKLFKEPAKGKHQRAYFRKERRFHDDQRSEPGARSEEIDPHRNGPTEAIEDES